MPLGICVTIDDIWPAVLHREEMDGSLEQLAGRLLIQCVPATVDSVVDIAIDHDAGIVLTGSSPEAAVVQIRKRNFGGPILCDANRYAGKRRIGARRGIRPAWCRRQNDLGLLALTDSGYLEPRDWIGLRAILRGAERQEGLLVAVLPMAARWFKTPALCTAIVREINKYGVPVAFVLEHASDPFSSQYLIRGFLQVLRSAEVPILLLRCDTSAIGALCHGAHAAAIGTTSALRHLYPNVDRSWRPSSDVAIFVPSLLSYHGLSTCRRVFEAMPGIDHLWACDCPICQGTTPDRIRYLDGVRTAAFQHSLSCQLTLHGDLFRRVRVREQLVSAWHEACSHALNVHEEVRAELGTWTIPANLNSWYRVTDDPLPHRDTIPQQIAGGTVPATPRQPSE